MKIKDIDLGPRPVFLAPMEDVTDPAFRLMCKHFGADMVYTEFVSADAIIPASLVLDGYADTFQRLHEESACVLRNMPENLPHPYYSINRKIFSGSKRNIQLPQKDLKHPFLLNLVLP